MIRYMSVTAVDDAIRQAAGTITPKIVIDRFGGYAGASRSLLLAPVRQHYVYTHAA